MAVDILASLFTPSLDWLQVEITTFNQGTGTYSLFKAYEKDWQQEHMPLELFHELEPVMRRAKLVHLQGWGEPFLHSRFFDMLRLVKKTGVRAASATHRSDLDEAQFMELVKCRLDSLTLHVTGPDMSSKAPGTELGGLIRTIDAVSRVKSRMQSQLPQIYVLCTLTRSGLEDLARLPGLLAGSGVALLIVNALTLTTGAEMEKEVLVPANDEEYEELRARLVEIKQRCRHGGLDMHFFLLHGRRKPRGCIERPHRSAFVSVRGEVAPCAFCSLPVQGEIRYRFQGLDMEFPQISFGNVTQAPFKSLWRKPGYKHFRREFARGRLPDPCQGCWRPYLVAE